MSEPITQDQRIQQLEDQVEYLKAQLVEDNLIIPPDWKLSRSETTVLRCLMRKPLMTPDNAMAALYSERGGDEPEAKIIDLFIFRLRAALRAKGVEINNRWGQGFYLTTAMKQRVRDLCAAEGGAS